MYPPPPSLTRVSSPQNDNQLVERLCFPAMRHQEGDEIRLKDCVLLASGSKDEPPFVGKVAAIFQNPEDSEWMAGGWRCVCGGGDWSLVSSPS